MRLGQLGEVIKLMALSEMFFFINPLDEMQVCKSTLEEIRVEARKYIGEEDWEGKIITQIRVCRATLAEIVT